jgi:orotidine-5'-phosphate decarboxylase
LNIADLIKEINRKKSFLCVGLDSHLEKTPAHLGNDVGALLEFNKAIISATSEFAVSYKINTAFYEQYGAAGWGVMEETLKHIPSNCFTIADAKRGDIGNTSSMYAKAFLENMDFDSITVAPYMGRDSVEPFLQFGKVVIVLGLTSNSGSSDFQTIKSGGKFLYEQVLETAAKWGNENNMMFVTGATKAESLADIRKIIPKHFLLVPGVGAQGGSLEKVIQYGMNKNCGLLVNSSRGIIYASQAEDFAEVAAREAKKIKDAMEPHINT